MQSLFIAWTASGPTGAITALLLDLLVNRDQLPEALFSGIVKVWGFGMAQHLELPSYLSISSRGEEALSSGFFNLSIKVVSYTGPVAFQAETG